jgi:D-glycero-alpha-D-manno-heptose-7-phosphate kinase
MELPTGDLNPQFIVNSQAPIRICDIGGWTDTWFAVYGKVLNIAVTPLATVIIASNLKGPGRDHIIINAENFGDRYIFHQHGEWVKHPLIEAAISHIGIPDNLSVEITISCAAPAGSATGTSAAVTVALIGALARLNNWQVAPAQAAQIAHKVETELLGQQSGIQDQICAAHGGINFIEMTDYPQAKTSPLGISPEILFELEQRLVLIYLGSAHQSSQVHQMVIDSLEDQGSEFALLNHLRNLAQNAYTALLLGDLIEFGMVMKQNNEAQRSLHPALISTAADQAIEIASDYGALGWKVNGAGGEGGSITILCDGTPGSKQKMIAGIETENSNFKHIPTRICSAGLDVRVS